jgi:pimeloyl-ACP methyl ester carboxylesterase
MRRALDQLLDRVATWSEDRVRRTPTGYRPAGPGPLACFGPLRQPAAVAPPRRGRWEIPSPALRDDRISVHVSPASPPGRGVAILVPPWKTRTLRVVAGWSRLLSRAGYETWVYVPPHHLERARGRRGGEGFVSPDLRTLRGAVEQVVVELRALVSLALPRGEVALVGLSLGALGAALAATAPEAVDHAVLVAPPDLAESLAATAIGARYRRMAERAGAPLPAGEALREQLEPLSPRSRPPTARRVMIAAGAHDLIVPPSAPSALARSWQVEPRIYPRGHLTLLLACGRLRRDVGRFLAS